jgi:hypothetical protein
VDDAQAYGAEQGLDGRHHSMFSQMILFSCDANG